MTLSWFTAAKQNDFQFLVRNAITHIRAQSPRQSRTALMISARHANAQLVSLLKREISMRDAYNRTALMYAAYFNNSAIVPLLDAEKGYKCLYFRSLRGATALQIAADAGNMSICRMLVDEAQISQMTKMHLNALFHLPAYDAAPDSQRRTPAHYAALNPEEANDEFYAQFEDFSLDIAGKSPLHLAVEAGNLCCVSYYARVVPTNVAINFRSRYGENTTALMWAVEHRNQRAFKQLQKYQAAYTTDCGLTCLAIAVLKGFNEFIPMCFADEFTLALTAQFTDYAPGTTVFQLAEKAGNLRALEILRMCQYYMAEPKPTNDSTLRSQIREQRTVMRMRSSSTSQQFNSGVFKRSASAKSRAEQVQAADQPPEMHVSDLRGAESWLKAPTQGVTQRSAAYIQETKHLQAQLERQEQQLRVYQQREAKLLQQLKTFNFPPSFSLHQCVNELVATNCRLKQQFKTSKPATLDAQLQTSFSTRETELEILYSQKQLSEVQEKLDARLYAHQRFEEDIQASQNLQKCQEIFAKFYGDEMPSLEEIAAQAQLLAGQLHCGFADIASLLEHVETELEEKEQTERRVAIKLRGMLEDQGVFGLENVDIGGLADVLRQKQTELSSQSYKGAKDAQSTTELTQQLQNVQENVRNLTSQCMIARQHNDALEQQNQQLLERLSGSDAELKACKQQLNSNLQYKTQLIDICSFLRCLKDFKEVDLPDNLDNEQREVLTAVAEAFSQRQP